MIAAEGGDVERQQGIDLGVTRLILEVCAGLIGSVLEFLQAAKKPHAAYKPIGIGWT